MNPRLELRAVVRAVLAAVPLAFCGVPAGLAAPQAGGLQRDLLPPLDGAKFRFGTGQVEGNHAALSPDLPPVPGPVSGWEIRQWKKKTPLQPLAMQTRDPATADPSLGVADYAWTAPGDESHLWLYRAGPSETVELASRNGYVDAGGGANVFLATDVLHPDATLDHDVRYTLKARISKARVSLADDAAATSGAVVGQAFTAFWLRFQNPKQPESYSVAMQFELADSRDKSVDYRRCTIKAGGSRQIIYASASPPNVPLPFADGRGPFRTFTYDLDKALCDLLSKPIPCAGPDGGRDTLEWSDDARDPANWRVVSTYTGLETQSQDDRPKSTNRGVRGDVAVALQISGLRAVQDMSRTVGACPAR